MCWFDRVPGVWSRLALADARLAEGDFLWMGGEVGVVVVG